MHPRTRFTSLVLIPALSAFVFAWSAPAALDTNRIIQVTGLPGSWNATEGVFKLSLPRTDLPVKVDGWNMPPFMGLTTWAAFVEGKKTDAMVAGDLVLLEDEVNPVMTAALEGGLSVTALHNHFFFDDPKVYFMHIGGEGAVERLAGGVKAALARQKEIRAAASQPARLFGSAFSPRTNAITIAPLEAVFSQKAASKEGMAKFVIGRETKMPCGCVMAREMGVNTWAAFAGVDDNAVVDGDFAVLENELQFVLKTLRHDNINIVAIHHHMIQETPRTLFIHYWGRGSAMKLAESVQRALLVQQGVALSITPAEYEEARTAGATVVDVCTAAEFAASHIPGAVNLDINAPGFTNSAAKLDRSKTVIVNCHFGIRGARAAAVLKDLGFDAKNLEGGMAAWEATGNRPVK